MLADGILPKAGVTLGVYGAGNIGQSLAAFGSPLLAAALGFRWGFWTFGVLLLAYPAYLGVRAHRLPMINDVTTDPLSPPRFDVVARLRPRGTVDYAGLYAAEQQRAAYPDIEPLEVSATAQVAYDATLAVITKRKWRVVVERFQRLAHRRSHRR